ncbi:MAG: helix-turn-helix domain-containing protein [Oscillospiraceae bacterium]
MDNSLKEKGKAHSVLSNWILSYVAVLCIPLLLSFCIAVQSLHSLEREIVGSGYTSLMSTGQFLDSKLTNVRNLAAKLGSDQNVGVFQTLRYPLSSSDHYLFHQIQTNLKTLASADVFNGGIYLYNNSLDMLLTNRDTYYTDNLQFANRDNWGIKQTEFLKMMKGFYRGEFILVADLPEYTGKESKESLLLYAISLPYGQANGMRVNLFVEVNVAELESYLSNQTSLFGSTTSLFVRSGGSYRVALDPESSGLKSMDTELLQNATDGLLLDGERYDVLTQPSEMLDGSYFILIPEPASAPQLKLLQTVTILALLFCVLLGGLLIFSFTKRHYMPLKQLIQQLDDPYRLRAGKMPPQGERPSAGYEYTLLQDTISNLLTQRATMETEMEQSAKLNRSAMLIEILEGREQSERVIRSYMESLSIPVDNGCYCVAVVDVDSYETLFFGETADGDEVRQLGNLVVRNISEELLRVQFAVETVEYHGSLAFLLFSRFASEDLSMESSATRFFQQARDLIAHYFGITFHFNLGGQKSDYSQIPDSYREAKKVQEYNRFFLSGPVETYGELRSPGGREADSPRLSAKLLNCMAARDYAAAKQIISSMFAQYSAGTFSLEQTRCRAYGAVGIILEGLPSPAGQEKPSGLDTLERELYASMALPELEQKLLDILDRLETERDLAEGEQRGQAQDRMLHYVNERAFDPELTISSLAEHMGMSVSGVSKLFKQVAGVGFLDYVHDRRVVKAKELLLETDEPLAVISARSGFSNDISLIRTFKKSLGITPGKYREMRKLQQ